MCGISGFNFHSEKLINQMLKINDTRGPDFKDYFSNNEMTLGHNRLAIMDKSTKANQPMKYKNLIIIFNGEIFNYLELKKIILENKIDVNTNSDTEIVLKIFYLFRENSFEKLSGIFAISIYDLEKKILYLARDKIGVKRIYYYHHNNKFIFSSLIKAILKFDQFSKELNKDAVNYFLNFGRNDLNETFFKNIYEVNAGEILIFQGNNLSRKNMKKITPNNDYVDIEKIIANQTMSDFPIALSLSGGIDSNIIFNSLINNDVKFKAYTVNFEINGIKDKNSYFNNDANIAFENSKKNNILLDTITIKHNDVTNELHNIPKILEEPSGNQNSLLNFILAKNITEKVLISGDGGDEVFCGYTRYKTIYLYLILKKILVSQKKIKFQNKHLNRLLNLNSSKDFYHSFSDYNTLKQIENFLLKFEKIKTQNIAFSNSKEIEKLNLGNIAFHDIDTWIKNDVLLRNDKIYSNFGIETRVPFLDQRIIESYLFKSNFWKLGFPITPKKFLKKNFTNYLKNTSKIKMGFFSPIYKWMLNENKSMTNYILSKDYYNSEFIDYKKTEKYLQTVKSEANFRPYFLWNLINLQIFMREFNF